MSLTVSVPPLGSVGGRILAEYNAGTAAGSPQRKYAYGGYVDEPLALINGPTGGVAAYYHQNGRYDVVALSDAAGAVAERYAYDAYGDTLIYDGGGTNPLATSALGNRFAFTGRERDAESGLYYFRARYYDCALGRFVGRDPSGYADGRNLYAGYFAPESNDPSGLQAQAASSTVCEEVLAEFTNPHDPGRAPELNDIKAIKVAFNCNVNFFCGNCGKNGNGDPLGGQTFVRGGYVHVCINNNVTFHEHARDLTALLIHETIHAVQYCRTRPNWLCNKLPWRLPNPSPGNLTRPPRIPIGACMRCLRRETPAYEAQAEFLFPGNEKRQDYFVQLGKYFSCAHVCPALRPPKPLEFP